MREKFIIYQLFVRTFGNTNKNCVSGGPLNINGCGKFRDITGDVLSHIKKLQVSYIWYTGIIEHSTRTDYSSYGIRKDNNEIVKGEAGSPYAIKDYYDVDPDLAIDVNTRMQEFEALVNRTHNSGIKVLIDFVPNHLSREYFSDKIPQGENFGDGDDKTSSFNKDNNFYYLINKELNLSNILHGSPQSFVEYPAKATGNDLFSEAPSEEDWYETVKLNYGIDYSNGSTHFSPRPKTWEMMLDVLLFWASKGIDGFRCDMAGMVPVEFWQWAVTEVKSRYPSIIFIGEIYERSRYEEYLNKGGFDYLYDKTGMYDSLKAISGYYTANRTKGIGEPPKADSITACWQSTDAIQNRLLYFLENHDEQRIASEYNLGNPFYAIPELMISLMLNRAPFMLYNGQEFGEKGMIEEGFSGIDGRSSIYDYSYIPTIADYLTDNLNKCNTEIYNIYLKLLFISINEPAIRNGDLYDLQFANTDPEIKKNSYAPESMYSFIRRTRKTFYDNNPQLELVLCVTDFTQTAKNVEIVLPDSLFKSWNITENSVFTSENLLTESAQNEIKLGKKSIIEVDLNEYGIAVIKLTLRQQLR